MKSYWLLCVILTTLFLTSCGDGLSYDEYRDKATRLKAEITHLELLNSSVSDSIDAIEARREASENLYRLKDEYAKRDLIVVKKKNEFFDLLARCDKVYWWRARIYVQDRKKEP